MWAEACALLDEAERKHRHFFELLAAPATRPVWEPPADIFADGSEVEVVVALPGAHANEVVVQMTPTGLQIETTVEPSSPEAACSSCVWKSPTAGCGGALILPPGRYVLIERRLDRGCLYLRLTREAP